MPAYRDCAVVYVVWNRSGAEEALASARSVRRVMPDIAIYLKSAEPIDEAIAKRWRVFDHVVHVRGLRQSYSDKFHFLTGVKEKNVLYLDSDTYVVSGLRDAFDLLGRFDVACAHAPVRFGGLVPDDPRLPRIPASFPEFNSGVIFCRNHVRVRRMLRTCRELHSQWEDPGNHTPDQPALRCGLWMSRISFYVLPPEYNARLCFPTFLSGPARILHARLPEPRRAARIANQSLLPRVFRPEDFA